MSPRKLGRDFLVSVAGWIIGVSVTYGIGGGMSAVAAYSIVVGWWLCAYFARTFAVGVQSAALVFVAYYAVFIVLAVLDVAWLYLDVSSLSPASMALIGAMQSLLISSPILFNSAFDFFKERLLSKV